MISFITGKEVLQKLIEMAEASTFSGFSYKPTADEAFVLKVAKRMMEKNDQVFKVATEYPTGEFKVTEMTAEYLEIQND